MSICSGNGSADILWGGLRQIDFELRLLVERRRHHEEDQHQKDDIDQRRDVDARRFGSSRAEIHPLSVPAVRA
jgi:hypothetical protein